MAVEIEVDTVLFDMDGTLIDSTPAVNATWVEFAKQYNLDIDHVVGSWTTHPTQLHYAHGHRTVENLKHYIPSLEGDELMNEVVRFESRILDIAEANLQRAKETGTAEGTIIPMPGAKQLLAEDAMRTPAGDQDGLSSPVVSTEASSSAATSAYAKKGFKAADVAEPPPAFVTSDLCTKGKPDPEPYCKGAELSHADVSRCLVVEDAPPGVVSGKRAGARVLGLRTTHDGRRMWEQGADWVVPDLSYVHARWEGHRLLLTIESEPRP